MLGFNWLVLSLGLGCATALAGVGEPDARWQRLLHLRPNGESRVVSREFFFSEPDAAEGLEKAELVATAKAMLAPMNAGQENSHPICRFPARARYLRELGYLIPSFPCPDFEAWRARLSTRSLTLVFSSAYPQAPASLFGHSFLRLNSLPPGGGILDYGVNFSAETGPEDESADAVSYALKGVLGLYPGKFALAPYYLKLNEYLFTESRDLWEYDLNFDDDEVSWVVSHLWELIAAQPGGARFRYFYFDENCAFQMLALLEVARPETPLTRFGIYAAPVDTLQRVVRLGWTRSPRFRASLHRTLWGRFLRLEGPEKASLTQLLKSGVADATATAGALDVAAETYLFRKQQAKGVMTDADRSRYREILLARSRAGSGSSGESDAIAGPAAVVGAETERPDLGHAPYVAAFGAGVDARGGYGEIWGRLAIHDWLNDARGYIPNSEFRFFEPHVRFRPAPELASLELFRVSSFYPLSWLEKLPSWRVRVGYERLRRGCAEGVSQCSAITGTLGAGGALSFGPQERGLVYALALAGLRLDRGGELGAEIGMLLRAGSRTRLVLSARGVAVGSVPGLEFEGAVAWSAARDWEVRGSGAWDMSGVGEFTAQLLRFF